MPMEGYADYKRREYCKETECRIQLELDAQQEGSEEYQNIRQKCQTACIRTTYEFHHWLIDKGYLIVRPEK